MEFSWDKLVNSIKEHNEIILATIIDKRGSTPRGINTSMIILPDADIIGTIGGGPVENEIIKESLNLMQAKSSKIIEKNFSGEEVICGGRIKVLLEYFNMEDMPFLNKLLNEYNKGKNIFITRDLNNFKRELFEKINNIPENNNLYIQQIKSPPELLIFGAGHIAVPLCKMASLCDFSVFVYDDRDDFARKERFLEAKKVILCDFNNIMPHIKLKNNTFIVLVTREHAHDEILLKQLLGQPYKYLGMIGSKKRVSSVKNRLKKANFNEKEIDNIFSPIGLKINSETPAEIAVSILAEIIMIKNKE